MLIKIIKKMIANYNCSYLHNSGKVCGKSCIRPEGCHIHWKAKKRYPCSKCGKPTASISGRCPLHIRGFYVSRYYKIHIKAN
jgi:hypothetical protein